MLSLVVVLLWKNTRPMVVTLMLTYLINTWASSWKMMRNWNVFTR
jgi:hypothetical protein